MSHSRLVARLHVFSYAAALLAIAVGCLVIIGWLLHIDIFTRLIPGLVAMKVNTALGFVLAGIGLLSLRGQPRITQAMAVIVFLIGLLTLGEYFLGWNLGIDQWLIPDLVTPLNNYPRSDVAA